MRIALMIKPIVESGTPEPLFKPFKQNHELNADARGTCLVPYQVTYAAFNKIKFYLDFSIVAETEIIIDYLENVAEFTISKFKTSLQIPKGIIKEVTFDIDKMNLVIYFDIILNPRSAQTSFIELLSYLTNESF